MKPETAIFGAIFEGNTSKSKALAQAYRKLREAHTWIPQEEVAWAWEHLVNQGRLKKIGGRWTVVDPTPPATRLCICEPTKAPGCITSWVRKSCVLLDHEILGYAFQLPDGQWTTWRDGPRFATLEETAQHMLSEHLGRASLTGPLAGAGVTR